jgi:hypothetical protein
MGSCIDGSGCPSSSNMIVLSVSGVSGISREGEADLVIVKRSSSYNLAASFRSELATLSSV